MDDDDIIRQRERERALLRQRRGKPPAPKPTGHLFDDPAHWTIDDVPSFDALADLDSVGEHLDDVLPLIPDLERGRKAISAGQEGGQASAAARRQEANKKYQEIADAVAQQRAKRPSLSKSRAMKLVAAERGESISTVKRACRKLGHEPAT
jgi:hypothetical protein